MRARKSISSSRNNVGGIETTPNRRQYKMRARSLNPRPSANSLRASTIGRWPCRIIVVFRGKSRTERRGERAEARGNFARARWRSNCIERCAALLLAFARARGAFVFHGANRPIYTSTLTGPLYPYIHTYTRLYLCTYIYVRVRGACIFPAILRAAM